MVRMFMIAFSGVILKDSSNKGFFISNFIHKIMVNIVGHANNEEPILETLGRMVWVHAIFQPTLYNIGGPRK